MKLLIIEDEIDLQKTIEDFFKLQNFNVHIASNKFEAEDLILVNQFDILLLDIGLPDGNGIDLLSVIKKNQQDCGILIISAKNSIDDKIKGLDLGADDYITKPFHLAELNSRIKALLRRKNGEHNASLEFNEIKLNTIEFEATINSKNLNLTQKEYLLLLYFISNKHRVLTKESIAEHLWGNNGGYIDNYDFIYTHIKNLRKKINQSGGADYLKTIHGLGYKYTDE